MSDCIDDYVATIELIVQDYQILRKINQTHKLLSLLEGVDDNGFTRTKEFNKKYAHHGESHKTPVGKVSATLRAYYHDINTKVTEELIELLMEQKKKQKKISGRLWKEED